jgi:hypothetical protein
LNAESFYESLTPQGRAGKAVYLLVTQGPLKADELTHALGYRGRWSIYDLLDNLSQAVPLYYDERKEVWGILPEGDNDD